MSHRNQMQASQPSTPRATPATNAREPQALSPRSSATDSQPWRFRLLQHNTAPSATNSGAEESPMVFPGHSFLHTAAPTDRCRAAGALLAEARRYQRARERVEAVTPKPLPTVPSVESISHITSAAVRYRLLHPHPIARFALSDRHTARLLLSDVHLLMVPCSEATPDGNYAHVMGELGRLRLW